MKLLATSTLLEPAYVTGADLSTVGDFSSPAHEAVPSLSTLAESISWVQYHRGLGHATDDPAWRAPLHGVALPTANSLLGSLIADENVLAVRDVTMPPFTSGPWSPVARDTSQLGRLSIGGQPLYTERYKWTSYGFERHATTGKAQVTTRLILSHPTPLLHPIQFQIIPLIRPILFHPTPFPSIPSYPILSLPFQSHSCHSDPTTPYPATSHPIAFHPYLTIPALNTIPTPSHLIIRWPLESGFRSPGQAF